MISSNIWPIPPTIAAANGFGSEAAMENDVFLSADQTRQLLHISKRKCAWMLRNGIIPCTVSGKKTHCYRRDWLIDFMCGFGWRIIRKSKKHKEIIKRFYSEM